MLLRSLWFKSSCSKFLSRFSIQWLLPHLNHAEPVGRHSAKRHVSLFLSKDSVGDSFMLNALCEVYSGRAGASC